MRLNIGVAIAGMAMTGLMYAGCAQAVDMPAAATEFGCSSCHAIDHKVVGPAWMDVSKKYKGQATYKYSVRGSADPGAKEMPLLDGLIAKVSKGGSGNWGTQPMPANNASGNKRDKIKGLVEFILALSK